jgi:HD-GYP domain-containing protein (c-di-GMP phosphodiesterase class II)/signal transduction histidine kinase
MERSELYKKRFLILKEISNAIVVTDDISAVANLMIDLAINYTNAEKGSLMLINEQDELHILAAKGIDLELIRTYMTRVGEGIAGTVAKNRYPVLVEDIETDERFRGQRRDHYKTRSFISCPVMNRDRLLGVLNINDKKDDTPFTKDEFSLIKTIANHAAIALENAFLMNKLKAKASELATMNKKLIDVDIVKTEILNHLSHELRTPLNSIKGSVYYLQESEKPSRSEQMEFYNIISDEAIKLGSIVENLLDFLRHEDETKMVNKSIVNLRNLFDELLGSKMLTAALARKKLRLVTDINGGKLDIVADKTRVEQFFINLIEGMIPHIEMDDTIDISVRENEFIELNFSLPRSMPSSVLSLFSNSKYILQKNQPEEETKLYLARKVAELHRWELDARNEGNTFRLTMAIPKSIREKTEMIMTTAMDMFVEFISDLLGLNVCSIMLTDDLTGDLVIRSAKGLPEDVIKRTRISSGEMISGWVAREGKPLLIDDIEEDNLFRKKNVHHYTTKSLLSMPLKIQEKVIGVLNLNNKVNGGNFTAQDLQIAFALSERVSHFIEKFYLNEYKELRFKHFISSFSNLIDAVKKYQKKKTTYTDLMFKLMDRLGASEEEKRLGLYVSMIYDLGLMSIDENVLKKERLLPYESHVLKVHPYSTVFLLDEFEFSGEAKRAILHHHERYDGTGYPDRLKGDEIPFISRVVSVIDSFCAMTTKLPYRKKLTEEETLEELKKDSGTVYDRRVVEALDALIRPAVNA